MLINALYALPLDLLMAIHDLNSRECLTGANVIGVNLGNATLTGATMPDGTQQE